jgi:hypothetical protein
LIVATTTYEIMSSSTKRHPSASASASASVATATSASEDEYVRLKLELAQVTAATDTKRLQSRTLISERDGRREDTEKITADTEGQKVCFFLCAQNCGSMGHIFNMNIMCLIFICLTYCFTLYQIIIQHIKESTEKLREQIKLAEDERRKILKHIDGDGDSDSSAHR